MAKEKQNKKTKTFFEVYNEYLARYPLLINGLQSVVICIAAILASTYLTSILQALKAKQPQETIITNSFQLQLQDFLLELQSYVLREKRIEVPWQEIAVMSFINFFFITPVLYVFCHHLTKFSDSLSARTKERGGGWSSSQVLLLSVFIDQFIFSPPFNAAIISLRHYGYHGLTDFAYFQSSLFPLLKEILPSALLYAWCFWIPVKFFMFTSVPVMHQLLVGSCFAFLWNIIFTLIVSS